VTNFEYLDIIKRKTMEKAIAKEIKTKKKKDKEDRQAIE
jgi:hypothetical protein